MNLNSNMFLLCQENSIVSLSFRNSTKMPQYKCVIDAGLSARYDVIVQWLFLSGLLRSTFSLIRTRMPKNFRFFTSAEQMFVTKGIYDPLYF